MVRSREIYSETIHQMMMIDPETRIKLERKGITTLSNILLGSSERELYSQRYSPVRGLILSLF
jgi:hypothetical protein